MVIFTAGTLLLVKGAGPIREANRVTGPFVKCLAQELGTGPAEVNPLRLSAALEDGSDTAERLQVRRRFVAISPRSECGQ
jgi:hypothetical protein